MIPYSEFYNYDRLEKAAIKLDLLKTEADEENLLNLHNHLVWDSHIVGENPDSDNILLFVITEILKERNLDISELPEKFKIICG